MRMIQIWDAAQGLLEMCKLPFAATPKCTRTGRGKVKHRMLERLFKKGSTPNNSSTPPCPPAAVRLFSATVHVSYYIYCLLKIVVYYIVLYCILYYR
jgi:hypothetical protein